MQQNRSQVTERDGLFELDAGSDVLDSPRYNHDMAPTKVRERTWNKWHITALWVGMSVCVPTYTLGGVLTAYFGLSVGEALLAILLANIIVLIPLTLNAFPGTKYGIPFPVLLRSSFGILGSNVPCLIRAWWRAAGSVSRRCSAAWRSTCSSARCSTAGNPWAAPVK
jgi:NCS1 family nucleobase:cation symporter-1